MNAEDRSEIEEMWSEHKILCTEVEHMAEKLREQLASIQAELIIIRDDVATMRSGHAAICQQLRAHAESLVVLHGYHV